MVWRILGAGVFTLGVAAGVAMPRSPDAHRAVGAAVVASPVEGPVATAPATQSTDQRAQLETILDGMRGASPVACELALMAIGGRSFSWSSVRADVEETLMDSMTPHELAEWIMSPSHDDSLVPRLQEALAGDDVCVRRTAARLLGRNGSDAAVDALLDALRSADPGQRRAAAIGLGMAEVASTAPALRRALADTDDGVRAGAAWALGELEDQAAVGPLARALRDDGAKNVRTAAAWALGRMK